jgi:ABC-type glycerol-3-phosphate transport system substrate-binding protein
MSITGNTLRATAAATALGLLLAGCGGSVTAPAGAAVNNNPPVSPPVVQEITGVATPSSVAVVTATNAQ